jgi:predicted Rossmann-fold nucleotide-binding protein
MQTFIRATLLESGAISEKDLDLAFLTDDPREGVAYINKRIKEQNTATKDQSDMS